MKRTKCRSMFRIFILALAFSLISLAGAIAQRAISGTVYDAGNKTPMFGASVVVKGTTTGTVTGIDGKYTLSAKAGDILVVSFIGYLNEEVTLADQTVLDFELTPDISNLEQVVVIGYGVQKKKLNTGATVQVKSEELVKSNSLRLESSLQGLTPGMVIVKQSGQPGSDYNITIRGLGSVNGSTPLVLIDGVPGNLNTVNPSDIQSVDVLKDAASAAIYGSRASDGVILITTKKGKTGEPRLSYDFFYGVSNPPKQVEMLNAEEYMTIQNEIQKNMYPTRPLPFSSDQIANAGAGTNWQDETANKNAPTQNHNLSLSGGNDYSTYSLSLSYSKEEGIFDYNNKSQFERYGFRLNSEHKVKKRLTLGENLTYSHRNRTGLGVGNIYDNFLHDLLQGSPLISPFDESSYDGFGRSSYIEEQVNPIAVMHYNYNSVNNYDDLIGNVYAELEIIKGLKIRTDFGGTININYNHNVSDTFTITSQVYNAIPDYDQYMSRNFGYNWDNYLTYEKKFGEHNFLAMAGLNAQDNWYYNVSENADGFLKNPNLAPVPANVALSNELLGDTITASADHGKDDSRFSVFGRLSYNYAEKYMATFSLRRDGSSRFGQDNRYGTFPAFSAGWVISQESFMESISWLNFLKIRGSWGKNGKEPNLAYRYLATVGSYQRPYSFGNGWQTGMSPDIMPNPALKWEESEQLDFGFESKFLNDFSFAFDIYQKTSKDWIIPVTVPSISGSRGISDVPPYSNSGNVINKGIEIELGYTKTINDLRFVIAGNLAYNKNLVEEVPGEIIHGSVSVIYNGSDEFYRVEEGYPIGYFWGYKTYGLFQSAEEVTNHVNADGTPLQPGAVPGDVIRHDENGDGVIDTKDKVELGNPHPDLTYGINLSANYKGFDFSMGIIGMLGHQIVKCYHDESRSYYNFTSDILDRWQWVDVNGNNIVDAGEGTSDYMPRVTGGVDRNQNWRKFSDLYVEDADFLKIKNINLGYDFTTLMKNAPVGQFKVYVSATNLLTITKYSGLDPEVGYGSYYDSQGRLTDAYASGIDIGFYPAARTYLVGLNVTF